MQSRKTQNKNGKNHIKPQKDKRVKDPKEEELDDEDLGDEDFEELKPPIDEVELEERLIEEMPGEADVEDDDEFIQEVEKFKKEHSKSKIITIFKKIGNPKIVDCTMLSPEKIKEELRKIIVLLDEHNIIVHFHNDYTDKEKYRFITGEIFNEAVEKNSRNHISFIYEDYHPEMDEEDEGEEF
jgi:cytosine/adenosine deaminase-related metal-dependent hydrolase